MKKKRIGNNVFIPMPVALVGATVNGRANFMTAGWVTRANFQPPMLAVGINKAHYTAEGIREHKTFSVCFPGAELVERTDYCGLVSGRNREKSGLFRIFLGELQTAPMIDECPLCLECRLNDVMELPTNDLFVGEIVAAYADDECLVKGAPDYKQLKAMILTMPDNTYWSLGERLARAWSIGRGLAGSR